MVNIQWIAISGALLFILLCFAVASGVTVPFDHAVLLWINQHASPAFDTFFVFFTELGGLNILTAICLLLTGLLLWKKKYSMAGIFALSVGGAALVHVLLKSLFERQRPDLWEWLITESQFSFPSGHATATAAFALCICFLLWKTRWRNMAIIVGSMYVLAIGFSRLYLGVHFPTDILGGWLLGVSWTLLVIAVSVSISRRRQSSPKDAT